jgi:hypothetical protein
MAGTWNNFQNQGRLSEQLLESQATIGKPEQASWGLLTGKMFFTKRQQKTVRTISTHAKSTYTVLIFSTLNKNIHFVTPSL